MWFCTSDALRVRQFSLFTFTHTHCVCVRVCIFCAPYRPTLILSNVWEIFQHFENLGKGGKYCLSFWRIMPKNLLALPLDPAGGSAPRPPYWLALAMYPPTFKLLPPPLVTEVDLYHHAWRELVNSWRSRTFGCSGGGQTCRPFVLVFGNWRACLKYKSHILSAVTLVY